MKKFTFIIFTLSVLTAAGLFVALPAMAKSDDAAKAQTDGRATVSATQDENNSSVTINGKEVELDGKTSINLNGKDATLKDVTDEYGNVSVDLPGISVRVNGEQGERAVSVKMPGIDIHVDKSQREK